MFNRRQSSIAQPSSRQTRYYSPHSRVSRISTNQYSDPISQRSRSNSRPQQRFNIREPIRPINSAQFVIKPGLGHNGPEFTFGNKDITVKSMTSFMREKLNSSIVLTTVRHPIPTRRGGTLHTELVDMDISSHLTDKLSKYGTTFRYRTVEVNNTIPCNNKGPVVDICTIVKSSYNINDVMYVVNPDLVSLPQSIIPGELLQQSIILWKKLNKDVDYNAWLSLIPNVRDKVIFMSEYPYMNDNVRESISDEVIMADEDITIQILYQISPALMNMSISRILIGVNVSKLLVKENVTISELKGIDIPDGSESSRTLIKSVLGLLVTDFDYLDFTCRNPGMLMYCLDKLDVIQIFSSLCSKKNPEFQIDTWYIDNEFLDDVYDVIEANPSRAYEIVDMVDIDMSNLDNVKKLVDKFGHLLSDDMWKRCTNIYVDFEPTVIDGDMRYNYAAWSRCMTALELIFDDDEIVELAWSKPRGFLLGTMKSSLELLNVEEMNVNLEMPPLICASEMGEYIDLLLKVGRSWNFKIELNHLSPTHFEVFKSLGSYGLISKFKMIKYIENYDNDVIETLPTVHNTRIYTVVMNGVEVEMSESILPNS